MSVRLKKVVQVKKEAFISKVYIRKGTNGITGMVFEFSNGDRVPFTDSSGGVNTNPIIILEGENCGYGPVGGGVTEYGIKKCKEMKKTKVAVINMPKGFDMMKIGYIGVPTRYAYFLKQVYFYKNKVLVGKFVDSGWCCHTMKEFSLPEGQIACGFNIKHYEYADYWPYIFPVELYGMTDPEAKPIDGGWSDWSKWGNCSKPCGPGIKKRTRTCSNPYPFLGGKDCSGDLFEVSSCKLKDCDVDGGWGKWGEWSACNAECDQVGFQRRNRKCDNPKPSGGGDQCKGENYELKDCNGPPCNDPIDGGWSEYGSWEECLKNADGKWEQKRARQCNNPPPEFGGKPCSGAQYQLRNCVVEQEPIIDDTDGVLTVSSDSSTVTQSEKNTESSVSTVVTASKSTTTQEEWQYHWIIGFVILIALAVWVATEPPNPKIGGTEEPFVGSAYVSYA